MAVYDTLNLDESRVVGASDLATGLRQPPAGHALEARSIREQSPETLAQLER